LKVLILFFLSQTSKYAACKPSAGARPHMPTAAKDRRPAEATGQINKGSTGGASF
jgi:hypothetical protein